jgi:transcriptional regulator of aromatic amino acid metabolism
MLQEDPLSIVREGRSLDEMLQSYEEQIWRSMAQQHKKNADIAAALKVHPSTVTRKLQQFGIR